MIRIFTLSLFILCNFQTHAQQTHYIRKIIAFQEKYVTGHEVVKGDDKKFFRFFPVDKTYRLNARFTRIIDTKGFIMKTSGVKNPRYFKYGTLTFTIRDTILHLNIYQSEGLRDTDKYKNYLFVPYTDLTSGEASYGGGKYLEFYISDIKKNKVIIDFNKAYNPYCAYASGFNCPIPPRENDMNIVIEAGEMMFAKEH